MAVNIDELFGNDVILVYPDGTPINHLRHDYHNDRTDANGKTIDFDRVHSILLSLRLDVECWYQEKTGQSMDTYNLGNMLDSVQNRFWLDERFKTAFDILGVPYSEREGVKIPWWNEVAGGELEHRVDGDSIQVKLGPRHSYETQLIRSGYQIPIKSVSVGGIILSNDGHLVIGLRGGKTLPNTYHINAGALRVTDGLKSGEESIYDIFKRVELEPEFGIGDGDIGKVTVHSRIMDYSIERGPMYNFLVLTNLSREELRERWEANQDEDKKEHKEILFVSASPDAVNRFIRDNYKGVCKNKIDRADNERYLLHQGALSLASFSGISISELRESYQEGLH